MKKRYLIIIVLVLLPVFIFIPYGSRNTYYQTPNNGFGQFVFWGWIKQQAIVRTATDSRLESMALHSRKPFYRAMAFEKLADKRNPKCQEILIAELTDTGKFETQWLDLIYETDVITYDMILVEDDSLLFTKEQRHHIDSVIVFKPGLDHLDRGPSATRLYGMEGVYERVRELCLQGDSNLLPAIAEYKQPADIPLVTKALLNDEQYEPTINALAAIMKWRDEAYAPALEELCDQSLEMGRLGWYGLRLYFAIVMGYDNEWAYHLIDDWFENWGKESNTAPQILYEAYYGGKEIVRFLPLVEKYGKEPFNWEQNRDYIRKLLN